MEEEWHALVDLEEEWPHALAELKEEEWPHALEEHESSAPRHLLELQALDDAVSVAFKR